MSAPEGRIGFGCAGLSAQPSRGQAERLLGTALDEGIVHFDTAPLYGRGYSEAILGRWAQRRRDHLILATKFGLGAGAARAVPFLALPLNYWRKRLAPRPPPPRLEAAERAPLAFRRISRADVERSFDSSRRSLRTDFIDYYLLHEGLPGFLEPPALEYLLELRASGRVGRLGLAAGGCNYPTLGNGELEGWDVLQYEFGRAWPAGSSIRERFPACQHIFHSCLRAATGPARSDRPERFWPSACRRTRAARCCSGPADRLTSAAT
jgi:hypothetical protein